MQKNKQKGIALAYLIATIALLSALTAAYSLLSRNSNQAQWNADVKRTLVDQYQLILSRIIYCGVQFPSGDNGTTYRTRFPGATSLIDVSTLSCPGQAAPNNLWNGTNGMTIPASPARFSSWKYINDATSMRLTIDTAAADTQAQGVLDNVVSLIGASASRAGQTMTVVVSF